MLGAGCIGRGDVGLAVGAGWLWFGPRGLGVLFGV